jgi:enterochelin esterase-like enzyme
MGPTSVFVIVTVILAAIGSLLLLVRLRHWALKIVSGALALSLGVLLGLIAVNDNFGYYRNWSAVVDGVFGSASGTGADGGMVRVGRYLVRAGTLRSVVLAGPSSRITRRGLIYLPPQYTQANFAHTRFPVVELLHGSPGAPSDWTQVLDVVKTADLLIARRVMGPMVLVMPATYSGRFSECVNGRYGADETYLAQDVPHDVRARYRVSTDPGQWGLAGYSSGGYCAANLALRHRSWFGAAGVLDGYFQADAGPAATALGHNPTLLTQNSPLTVVRSLRPGTAPMPAFWVGAGSDTGADYASAKRFVAALSGLERISFASERSAGHDFYAWSAELPTMLAWMWQQLAPPDMRTEFPVQGSPSTVQVPPIPRRRQAIGRLSLTPSPSLSTLPSPSTPSRDLITVTATATVTRTATPRQSSTHPTGPFRTPTPTPTHT